MSSVVDRRLAGPRPERHEVQGEDPLTAPPDVWDQRCTVELAYPVVFTRNVLAPENEAFVWSVARNEPTRRHRLLVVVDQGVGEAWPGLDEALADYVRRHADRLDLVEPPRTIVGGEASKNDPALVAQLQAWFGRARMDRHACVAIVGGGAVLDVVGYAASTTHRGLRVVRLPTTVLAQNDAGIGVKTGINAFGTKNFLGTFASPFAVINDFDFIATLPRRDRVAGIAEAIKVALIRDPGFLSWLETHADALAEGQSEATAQMIRRCAELHLHHIRASGDPFETGSARPLDFGHWAAHKLEALSSHDLRHGEAVAIGIAIDTLYSAATGRLSDDAGDRVCRLLAAVGLPLWHPALDERNDDGARRVLQGLEEFREHLGGELTITLLGELGRGVETNDIDPTTMSATIDRIADTYG